MAVRKTTAADPADSLERALFEVKKVVVGQDRMIERMMVALLSRGHCLLEGVPGVAKSLAVETLAAVVGGSSVRLQFTPDLVPSDIVGTRIYRPSQEAFDVELGPVFANLVLADEINRAPAKVQSALLEVMAEHQVSIGGTTYPLPTPFLVLATQNPIESEGVYPLPEAQRDRFLMKIDVGHPSMAEEMEIVRRMTVAPPRAEQVLTLDELVTPSRSTPYASWWPLANPPVGVCQLWSRWWPTAPRPVAVSVWSAAPRPLRSCVVATTCCPSMSPTCAWMCWPTGWS
jgi:MoxR-like ATPase